MKEIQCINCKDMIPTYEQITKGIQATCDKCGCIMKCLDKNDFISRWRVINPMDIEDKRGL